MKKTTRFILNIFAAGLILSGCEKDGLIDRSAPAATTRIMFIHAVPEAIQFNFFTGDTKLTGAVVVAATGVPQGMGYNTANQPAYFGYAGTTAGEAQLRAILPQDYGVAEKDTIRAGEAILDTTVTIREGASYTVAAYGGARSATSLVLEDNLIESPDSGGIRFINLFPSTIVCDLEMTYTPLGSADAQTSLMARNIAYGQATGFVALPPGRYVFQRLRTGTATKVGTATTITRLSAQQNFTLCARGSLAAMLQVPHQ
ncbi:DUF4397 domain-containing protein [Chitinophaga lutea]